MHLQKSASTRNPFPRLGPSEPGEIEDAGATDLFELEPSVRRLGPQPIQRDVVGVHEKLTHDEATAGLEHAMEFAQGEVAIGDLTEHGHEVGTVECGVAPRQITGVAECGPEVVDTAPPRPLEDRV